MAELTRDERLVCSVLRKARARNSQIPAPLDRKKQYSLTRIGDQELYLGRERGDPRIFPPRPQIVRKPIPFDFAKYVGPQSTVYSGYKIVDLPRGKRVALFLAGKTAAQADELVGRIMRDGPESVGYVLFGDTYVPRTLPSGAQITLSRLI